MTETANTTYLEQLLDAERKFLNGRSGDFAELVRASEVRRETVAEARRLDGFSNDAGTVERLRQAAVEGDRELRSGERGRPPKSPARREYEAYCQEREEADLHAKAALQQFGDYLNSAWQAWIDCGKAEKAASTQLDRLANVKGLLDTVIAQLDEAEQGVREGRQLLRSAASAFAISNDPFAGVPGHDLREAIKRWRTSYEAETARLGRDPAAERAEQQDKRRRGEFRRNLDKAAHDFRSSPEGREQWAQYRAAMTRFNELRERCPADDSAAQRKIEACRAELQQMLNAFNYAACAATGVSVIQSELPQIQA